MINDPFDRNYYLKDNLKVAHLMDVEIDAKKLYFNSLKEITGLAAGFKTCHITTNEIDFKVGDTVVFRKQFTPLTEPAPAMDIGCATITGIEDFDNYLNDKKNDKLYQKAVFSYRDVVRGANFICSQIRKEKREK